MPHPLEIRLHYPIVLAPRLAKCIPFGRMRDRLVLVQGSMARVALRRQCPCTELVHVTAHERLSVADGTRGGDRRHEGIVGGAGDILAQGVEAVVDVGAVEEGMAAALEVSDVAVNVFLGGRLGRPMGG